MTPKIIFWPWQVHTPVHIHVYLSCTDTQSHTWEAWHFCWSFFSLFILLFTGSAAFLHMVKLWNWYCVPFCIKETGEWSGKLIRTEWSVSYRHKFCPNLTVSEALTLPYLHTRDAVKTLSLSLICSSVKVTRRWRIMDVKKLKNKTRQKLTCVVAWYNWEHF